MTNEQAILLACEAAMKASVILAGGLAVSRVMTKTSAASRHLVLGLTIVGAAAVVPASAVLPSWKVPILAPLTQPVPSPAPDTRASHPNVREHAPLGDAGRTAPPDMTSELPVAERAPSPAENAAATVPRINTLAAAAAIWALGALAVLLWHAAGLAMVARMRRSAAPSTNAEHLAVLSDVAHSLGIRGDVHLVTSHRAAMPATWGIIRPGILLPADADTWSANRLRSVLHHELAHVARHDCRWQLASTIACAVHWYNPLAWLAARALRAERERACDDLVIDGGTDACDYADHLLAIAQQYRAPRATGMAAIAMARPSQLEGRLLAILNATTVRAPLSRARRIATVGLIMAALLPTAAMRPWRTVVTEPSDAPQVAGATLPRLAELAPLPRMTDTLTWTRRMKSGQWLRVYTMKSDVVVERSPDSDVHIATIFGADDGRGLRVHEFDEDDRSIEVCPALPASVKRVPRSGCWPVDWEGEVEKDNTLRTVVRVPDDIQVDIKTGSGSVFADDAHVPIVAGSSEGSVKISTQSWATANVVGGDVDITFLRTAWRGSLAIKSVSGRITLSLPDSANTSVEVMNSAGDAKTSFALDRVWRGDRWRFHGEATLGNGGRRVSAESWTGKIFVKQGGRDASIPMERSSSVSSP